MHHGLQAQILLWRQIPDHVLDVPAWDNKRVAGQRRIPAEERDVNAVVIEQLMLVPRFTVEERTDEAPSRTNPPLVRGKVYRHSITKTAHPGTVVVEPPSRIGPFSNTL